MTNEKRLKSEDRKRSIIQAALPLFAAKGVEGTTTKQIAQAAKVSEALLYKHFPSKESLYEQIQEFMCSQAGMAASELVKMPCNTNSMIHVLYATLYLIYIGAESEEERQITSRLLSFSMLEDGDLMRTFLDNRFRVWIPQIIELMKAAQEAGDLDADDTPLELKVWMVHHLAVGFLKMNMQQIIDYGLEPKEILAHMARFAFRGVGLKKEAMNTFFNAEALYHFSVGLVNKVNEEI